MLNISQRINTEIGVYIELECSDDTKRRLNDYVRKYIDPDSEYLDFHTTLIYSKQPFNGIVEYKINNLDKLYAGATELIRFDNPEQNIYAIALKLKCSSCSAIHHELMSKYNFNYDFAEYIPHVTLTYKGNNVDISKIPLPHFFLKFDKFNVELLNDNWASDVE